VRWIINLSDVGVLKVNGRRLDNRQRGSHRNHRDLGGTHGIDDRHRAGRRRAADHDVGLVFLDRLAREADGFGRIRPVVVGNHLDGEGQIGARRPDLVEQIDGIALRCSERRGRPRHGNDRRDAKFGLLLRIRRHPGGGCNECGGQRRGRSDCSETALRRSHVSLSVAVFHAMVAPVPGGCCICGYICDFVLLDTAVGDRAQVMVRSENRQTARSAAPWTVGSPAISARYFED
jgi:hypothetical protein